MRPGESEIDSGRLAARVEALLGVERIRAAAADADVSAYLVGGAVRDLLLGLERADVDVAVEGDPLGIARALGGELRSHERFATATVRVEGLTIDIAATRAETYAQPGALPEVRWATLAEDLDRRDFTVNAMAVPLRGEPALIDRHGGADDLRDRQLKVLHGRSLADDPTRALRAARYAARLGLEPESETLEQLRSADLETVSAERIQAELTKLALEPEARRGFELLADWGQLDLPARAGELIDAVTEVSNRSPWRALGGRVEAVLALISGRAPGDDLAAARPRSASDAARLARGRTPAELLVARARGAEWLDRYVAELRHVRLEIGGRDLLAAGIEEGPAIGRGLAAALDAKLDDRAASPDDELAVALRAAQEPA